MKNLQYPLELKFNIKTLSNDFTVKDANDNTIAYVKQKLLKLVEEITVYTDESMNDISYKINANKWLDFSAAYAFSDKNGNNLGKVARKGWASLWKAKYEIFNINNTTDYLIQEENGWVKVADALISEIPFLNFFTGYLFNPTYKVVDENGNIILRLKKEASFFGRKFSVTKLLDIKEKDEERIILSLMMMILLERRRG